MLWQIQGEVKNWLDRVRNRQATGYAVFWGKDIDTKEAAGDPQSLLPTSISRYLGRIAQGERGILRSRLNRFKDGCEAYYVHLRTIQRIQEAKDKVVLSLIAKKRK